MEKKTNIWGMFLALAAIVDTTRLPAAPVRAKPATYESDFHLVDSFRSKPDLMLMQKTCDRLFSKWKSSNPSHFIDLSCEACEVLNSINFHNPKQFALAKTYALDALNNSASKSIDEQSCLVLYGLSSSDAISPGSTEDWEVQRIEVAGWWLSTWKRIDQNIIPNFNPRDYPYMLNIPAPAGLKQIFFSGMSPDNIADPKMRRQYEEAIAKNAKNAAIVGQQRDLTELRQTFNPIAERRIITLYASKPSNPVELKLLLQACVSDQKSKQEITDAVDKAQNTKP